MRSIAWLIIGVSTTAPTPALDLKSVRAQHKLPPLSPSATLSGAAQAHASDMTRV
jgi:hypothetical protein